MDCEYYIELKRSLEVHTHHNNDLVNMYLTYVDIIDPIIRLDILHDLSMLHHFNNSLFEVRDNYGVNNNNDAWCYLFSTRRCIQFISDELNTLIKDESLSDEKIHEIMMNEPISIYSFILISINGCSIRVDAEYKSYVTAMDVFREIEHYSKNNDDGRFQKISHIILDSNSGFLKVKLLKTNKY